MAQRDLFWDLQRHAHEFFTVPLPFLEMRRHDQLTTNPDDFVFARAGEVYAVYLPEGGFAELDLTPARGKFEVKWYDARQGGDLQNGSVRSVSGGGRRSLGEAPKEKDKDWAVSVRRTAGKLRTNR